jgi:hypothetical protein
MRRETFFNSAMCRRWDTPEINDPLLLETRFPQFVEKVNQLMDRARGHFAQYFPNDTEQTSPR